MPMYYELSANATASGTAGSQTTAAHAKLLTGTGVSCAVKGLYAAARGGTAGGGILRAIAAGTALSTMGSTYALVKRNSNYATAVTSGLTGCTHATAVAGASPQRIAVGFAQTGGMGGWVAIEPDAAVLLQPGGSTNGNLEFSSICNAASVTFDMVVEVSEQ